MAAIVAMEMVDMREAARGDIIPLAAIVTGDGGGTEGSRFTTGDRVTLHLERPARLNGREGRVVEQLSWNGSDAYYRVRIVGGRCVDLPASALSLAAARDPPPIAREVSTLPASAVPTATAVPAGLAQSAALSFVTIARAKAVARAARVLEAERKILDGAMGAHDAPGAEEAGLVRHTKTELDTLQGLSLRYDVPMMAIRRANNLAGDSLVSVPNGATLVLPANGNVAAARAAAEREAAARWGGTGPAVNDVARVARQLEAYVQSGAYTREQIVARARSKLLRSFARWTGLGEEEAHYYLASCRWTVAPAFRNWRDDEEFEQAHAAAEQRTLLEKQKKRR